MSQAQANRREATPGHVEVCDEPRTEPRIRIPPLLSGARAQAPRHARWLSYVSWLRKQWPPLGLAPALLLGAALGSAPYLLEERARRPPQLHELPVVVSARAEPQTLLLTAAQPAPAVRLSPPAPAQPEAEPSLSRRALGPAHARPGVTQSKSPRLRSRRGLEGTLLKLAEQQLRRGDSFGAQLRLAELARRVPRGALMQERKWTEIHVLLAVGDESSARRAAGEFAKAYPHSARLPELATLLLGP